MNPIRRRILLLGSVTQRGPQAIAATLVTPTSFQANWLEFSPDTTGYRLDVSTSPTFSSFVSGFNNLDVHNVTSYSVTGLTPDTVYYYRVRAYNAIRTSANSNVIKVPADLTWETWNQFNWEGFLNNWETYT